MECVAVVDDDGGRQMSGSSGSYVKPHVVGKLFTCVPGLKDDSGVC